MALLTDKQFFIVAAAAAVALVVAANRAQELGGAVADNLQVVNPASSENFIYSGISSMGQAITGDTDITLGTAIYDVVDGVRGWFGDSDEDRMKKAELEARPVYETRGSF